MQSSNELSNINLVDGFKGPENKSLATQHLEFILQSLLAKKTTVKFHEKKINSEVNILVSFGNCEKKTLNLTEILKAEPNFSHIQLSTYYLDKYIDFITGSSLEKQENQIKEMFNSAQHVPAHLNTAIDEQYPDWHIAHKLSIYLWTLKSAEHFSFKSPLSSLGNLKPPLPLFSAIQSLFRAPHKPEINLPDCLPAVLLTCSILCSALSLGLKHSQLVEKKLYRFEQSYEEDYKKIREKKMIQKNFLFFPGFKSTSCINKNDITYPFSPFMLQIKKVSNTESSLKKTWKISIKNHDSLYCFSGMLEALNISSYSKYPLENEHLFLPRTFTQITEVKNIRNNITFYKGAKVNCIKRSDELNNIYSNSSKHLNHLIINELIFEQLSLNQNSNGINSIAIDWDNSDTQNHLSHENIFSTSLINEF